MRFANTLLIAQLSKISFICKIFQIYVFFSSLILAKETMTEQQNDEEQFSMTYII